MVYSTQRGWHEQPEFDLCLVRTHRNFWAGLYAVQRDRVQVEAPRPMTRADLWNNSKMPRSIRWVDRRNCKTPRKLFNFIFSALLAFMFGYSAVCWVFCPVIGR